MAYPLVWTHFTPQDVAALQKRLRDEWQEMHHAAHHERAAGSCLLAALAADTGFWDRHDARLKALREADPSDPEAKM
ncbi:hypothetical protein [Mitsuokella jalaludinii]|uniref:hypothetical protein n=1 Tax=Mitsuokella jalaludinii TaxID=187979 RepID=UPI003F9C29BA